MSGILSDAELAEVRAEIEIVMPETGRILYRTEEQTDGGGNQATYTPGPDLPAAIAPQKRIISGGEVGSAGDRIDDRTTHIITLPATTEVSGKDRVELDGWGVFEVLAAEKRSEAITKQVEAREVF
jgi:hypothetical protein